MSAKGQRRWLRRILIVQSFVIALLLAVSGLIPASVLPTAVQPYYRQILRLRERLAPTPAPSTSYDSGGVKVYYAPSEEIVQQLVGVIGSADNSIDVCVYDLDHEDIVAALLAAFERGVLVRIVTDDSNARLSELRPLKDALIPIKDDGRGAIMHNKFVVVDQRLVWTGSYNFTHSGSERNNNNAVIIASPKLAMNYQAEFNEMWEQNAFGPSSPPNTAYPKVELEGVTVETYFAPEDQVLSRILPLVEGAQTSIDLMAFSFTEPQLAEALRARHAAGVKLRCLFDARSAGSQYSQDDPLRDAGVPVRIARNRHGGVLHHKVIIIDGQTVITGSYNFSRSAENDNDENVVILHAADIAESYQGEFARCWEAGK